MLYTFPDIQINQRVEQIDIILQAASTPRTAFENTTFSFIREWLSGKETFELQTSGSTGNPKTIILSRAQLKSSAWRTIQALKLQPNDTAVVCLDTKYIGGKIMLVRALEGNLKIVAVDPTSNPLSGIAKGTKTDFTSLVPLQLHEILNNEESTRRLNSFKSILIGGAPLNGTLEKSVQHLTCGLYATYGMTETASHIALRKINGKERESYFRVLPGIYIEKDERGCLAIQMPGFEEKIVTNDLIDLVDSERFHWVGRFDTIVNSGGFKISPEKVESAIQDWFEVMNLQKIFFVIGIPDEKLGAALVLVIEGEALAPELENLLLSQLKTSLHPHEIPKKIKYTPRFTLTETGKINRSRSIS